jgi:hypothetical protein
MDDSGKVVLLLGQWRSSLIIRRPVPGYDVREKWKEIGADDALPKGVRRLITVASGEKGTSIYLNGKLARAYPNLNLTDAEPGITERSFILGNSPSGKASWSGDVFGLAFYNTGFNESEALESFHQWTKGDKRRNPYTKGEVALYLFNEGAGNRVQNALGATAPLMIPDHPAFQREILGRPLISKYNKISYIKDGVVNILGFIPFGLCVSLWIFKTGRWPKSQAILIAVGMGALLSSTIEIVQAFIPVRDSSLMDLICNTGGTVLGAGFWKLRCWEEGSHSS